jgi:hypothetical protein
MRFVPLTVPFSCWSALFESFLLRSPPIGRKELQIPREMINTKNIFRSETQQANHLLSLLNYTPTLISYGCHKKHLKLQKKQEEIRLYRLISVR